MPGRSIFLAFHAALWLWPAITYAQSYELKSAYNRFGELYAQGRYQDALPFAKKALSLSELEFGPNHLARHCQTNWT